MKLIKGCLTMVGLFFVVIIGIGVIVGVGGNNTQPGSNRTSSQSQASQPSKTDGLTGPQKNALRSAESYLRISGFSRAGLIEQLSADAGSGYDIKDATVAVDRLNVDWNQQAVKSAKAYLKMSGFSCKGLIEQLSADAGSKYTVEQANYGAKQAGACN